MLGLGQTLMERFLPSREVNENNKPFSNPEFEPDTAQALGKCEINKTRFLSCKHQQFYVYRL